jgi:hypothetical protein
VSLRPDASPEALLAEYRRLYRIEDAAKALLVGRLRDLPEEEMAALWANLVAAADVKAVPTRADS